LTIGVPDPHLWRRVAALEKQLADVNAELRRMSTRRRVTQLTGRIWLFTCTTDFNEEDDTATADLADLDWDDTGVNIKVEDPLQNYIALGLGTGAKGVCEEQLDLKGKRHYVVVEWKCP
jgi:hypothetical protein